MTQPNNKTESQSSDKAEGKRNENSLETKVERKERAEARDGIEDWTAHTIKLRAEKKASGRSHATGVGEVKDPETGKVIQPGFASAADLLGGKKELLAEKTKDDPLTKLKNKFEHPGRNDPDAGVDYVSARDAYQRFGLDKSGADKDLIGAVLRNEQYWLNAKDVGQEYLTEHRPFMMALKQDWTVGPGQVQIQIMKDLVSKYQDKLAEFKLPAKQVLTVGGMDVAERPADVAMLSLNKKNAALIVGAYFADVIEKLEKHRPPCSHGASDAANTAIMKLWNSGNPESRQEALIRSFNPDGEKHVQNVLKHLAEIKKSGR